jgi:DNA repair exonuclease SbcCD ATPase subunit
VSAGQLASLLSDLEVKVSNFENQLRYLEGQKEAVESQIQDNKKKTRQLKKDNDTYLKTVSLLQLVSEKTRAQSIGRIEVIATKALQEIYGNENLKFKIEFKSGKKGSTVDFLLWDDELQNFVSLTKAEAGATRNIVSTILRLLVTDLYHPKITGPIILDETGVHISPEYQSRFGRFLQQYSKLIERQIILVSHQDRVKEYADKRIRLTRQTITSKVTNE